MREASAQQADILLSEALDMFRYFKDADIESFLREKAWLSKNGHAVFMAVKNSGISITYYNHEAAATRPLLFLMPEIKGGGN